MVAKITVITGPAQSGKTDCLLATFRRALRGAMPGSTLWLSPTHQSVADVLARLPGPDLPACFHPGVMTFGKFAQRVLQASGRWIQPLPVSMKRQLIRFLMQRQRQAGKLKHFGPIASTHGLVDLICGFIAELKRLEIWPEDFRRACEARGLHDKDRELLAIYEAYQQRLRDRQLYDAEGRVWSARDLLSSGQTRPFDSLRLVVADGFTDFTRTQHEILALLAQRAEDLYISLPLEEEAGRDELFAKTRETLEELRRRSKPNVVIVQSLPRRSSGDWPLMEHLEAELFKNPRHARPASSTARIEIIAAPRDWGEVEQIGRRIKILLSEGCDASQGKAVPPGEILVVFRSLDEAAPLVREIFSELGIPFQLETGQALDGTPFASALLAMLRLRVEDWPFRQLLAVLRNNYFQPDWPEWENGSAAAATERLIRSLQIPAGSDALIDAVARRKQRFERQEKDRTTHRGERGNEKSQRELQNVRKALALLRRLRQSLTQLPSQATQAQWADALESLARELGLIRAIAAGGADLSDRDTMTWERLLQGVRDGALLFEKIGETPPRISPAEFLDLLVDLLRWQRLPRQGDDVGRVRVSSVASIRALSTPYLFFAGLSERAFPAPQQSSRLYSDGEYLQLRDKSPHLPLPLLHERNQEEMLLFYEVLTRASRQLWLSFPALDEKGEPLLPSPYLREVERACGEGQIPCHKITNLSPVPRTRNGPQSEKDFRIQAVDQALSGDVRLLAALPAGDRHDLRRGVLNGMALIRERASKQFGRFDGMIIGDLARAEIAKMYGADRRWSVSHLEQYALCPHQFFLDRVLGLEALDELALEPDYLQRGSLLHDLLARLLKRINAEQGEPASPAKFDPRRFENVVADILAALLKRTGTEHAIQSALGEIDRRVLLRWVDNFRRQHEAYDGRWKGYDPPPLPAHFEVSFGLDPVSNDPLSTLEPLVLSHDGETITIGGRIDRIDLGRRGGQTIFNIIDYKSGRERGERSEQKTPDGRRMQLELYALATEQVLLRDRGAKPLSAGYWYVSKDGYKIWEQFHQPGSEGLELTESWRTRSRLILDKVFSLIRAIRSAEFPMHSADKNCTRHCSFRTVCRVNHARALEKTWEPPAAT